MIQDTSSPFSHSLEKLPCNAKPFVPLLSSCNAKPFVPETIDFWDASPPTGQDTVSTNYTNEFHAHLFDRKSPIMDQGQQIVLEEHTAPKFMSLCNTQPFVPGSIPISQLLSGKAIEPRVPCEKSYVWATTYTKCSPNNPQGTHIAKVTLSQSPRLHIISLTPRPAQTQAACTS
jgi:hypothetical protein